MIKKLDNGIIDIEGIENSKITFDLRKSILISSESLEIRENFIKAEEGEVLVLREAGKCDNGSQIPTIPTENSDRPGKTSKVLDIFERLLGKSSKILKIDDFTYKINDLELSLAHAKEGVFIKAGLNLINLNDFFNKRPSRSTRKSEVPVMLKSSMFCEEKLSENDPKRLLFKHSPQKLATKPFNSSQKFHPVLNKPTLQRTKSPIKP